MSKVKRTLIPKTHEKMSDRKALIERKKILQSQPLTKWISVIETDGLNTQKKKHLVRLCMPKKSKVW